jgi:hypothetical protein
MAEPYRHRIADPSIECGGMKVIFLISTGREAERRKCAGLTKERRA